MNKIMRVGKTAKDRASGAYARSVDNQKARAAWSQQDRLAGGKLEEPFPRLTCNGKKNRTRWTGKGNTTVIV